MSYDNVKDKQSTKMQSCLYLLALLLVPLVYATPLDDYVNRPDSSYTFADLGNAFQGDGYTSYFINMTSQTWLSGLLTPAFVACSTNAGVLQATNAGVRRPPAWEQSYTDVRLSHSNLRTRQVPASLVSQSVWWHYLVINIPDKLEFPDTAFIYVTGGSNHDGVPEITSSDCLFTTTLAFSTATVTATLFQIPNEPIIFSEDPTKKSRGEDGIIAYTWYHYLMEPDKPDYLLRLPMTKAVVRAMDTISTFAATKNAQAKINKFVVAGASKRGWTTWTTGAVDKRVIGIVPIVMDQLNFVKNTHHHYRSLGGWTFAFKDYWELNITANLDNPLTQQLANVVDPYVYIDRLTMPKMVISTGGDEFFLPDDSYYYWDNLQGEKYTRVVPNAEHSLTGHFASLILDVRAFCLSILLHAPRPKMMWTMNHTVDGGYITMTTDTKPTTVVAWHATTLTAKRRDFRLLTGTPDPSTPTPQPVLWFSQTLKRNPSGEYVAKVSAPEEGWRAFFIQATFAGPRDAVFEFTTQVNIVPNTFPFPPCSGADCEGTLV